MMLDFDDLREPDVLLTGESVVLRLWVLGRTGGGAGVLHIVARCEGNGRGGACSGDVPPHRFNAFREALDDLGLAGVARLDAHDAGLLIVVEVGASACAIEARLTSDTGHAEMFSFAVPKGALHELAAGLERVLRAHPG